MKTLTNVSKSLEPVFTKSTTNIFPITGQIASASSQYTRWGNRSNPSNAFDNDSNTQWITGTGGRRSWIKIELPNPKQIWKAEFHPRGGHQQTTQYFTDYWFEGSNDDINYERILESSDHVTQVRTFEFTITKPYKFFKFEGDGVSTMGLTEIKLFEAIPITKDYIDESIDNISEISTSNLTTGFIPFSKVDSNNKLTFNLSNNLILDDNGNISTPNTSLSFLKNLDMNQNTIENLPLPVNNNDVSSKQYVDDEINFLESKVITNTTPADHSSGLVPYLNLVNGQWKITSTSNLQINNLGEIFSKNSDVVFDRNVDLNLHNLQNLASPVGTFDGVNKGYVDNITSNLLTKAELDVNIALPGIPLADDLVMAFVQPPGLRFHPYLYQGILCILSILAHRDRCLHD